MPRKWRSAKTTLDATVLAHCAPDRAWQWLETNNPRPPDGPLIGHYRDVEGRELIEPVLLRRREPLIDLALARYGTEPRVIKRVYRRGGPGVRVASLMNAQAGLRRTINIQRRWMESSDLEALVARGFTPEMQALLHNPFLDNEMYECALTRTKEFAGWSEAAYQDGVAALGSNRRMHTPYHSDYIDGWEHFSYEKVFDIAWSLPAKVPVSLRWASALYELLRRCPFSREKPDLDAIARWRISEGGDGKQKLGIAGLLRMRLGDRFAPTMELYNDDDPAFHASFYQRFDPRTLPDWNVTLLRDGEELFQFALQNPLLWQTHANRERLYEVASKLPDPHGYADTVNSYRAVAGRFMREHPDWFKDER